MRLSLEGALLAMRLCLLFSLLLAADLLLCRGALLLALLYCRGTLLVALLAGLGRLSLLLGLLLFLCSSFGLFLCSPSFFLGAAFCTFCQYEEETT